MMLLPQPVRPKWPVTWNGWLGFFATLGVVVAGSVGAGTKVFGLDTINARRAAVEAVIEVHERDMERLEDIEMTTWCLLWEVPAETCRSSFETRPQ